MIVDNDAKVMMMVDPEKKQYMTMTEDDAKQMQAMMGPMMEQMKHGSRRRPTRGNSSSRRRARPRRVAGVPCEMCTGEYTGEEGEKERGRGLRGGGRRIRAGCD